MSHKAATVLTARSCIISGSETCRAEVCLATGDAGAGSQWGFFFLGPPRELWGRVGARGVFPAATLGAFIVHRGADSGAMAEEQRDLISDRGSGVVNVQDARR